MDKDEFERLAVKVERVVDDLKTAKHKNKELSAAKKNLEQRLSSLEKQVGQTQKEGARFSELLAQNKAYKKKCALLKSRVTSMLAKVEGLQ
jgi:DNA repair exonuclease SbcCD ATPase subunit